MKKISFVIPCYKANDTITQVVEEINETLKQNKNYTYEAILVDDCSPDNQWEVFEKIINKNKNVKAISLNKNMGQHCAMMAGLSEITGDYVVIIDADGQCPVPNLWDLINELENGHDVALAKYKEYKQSVFKDIGTWLNRKMTEVIMGKPKNLYLTNFITMKRYIAEEIKNYKNPYPNMDGLLIRATSDIVNVEMEERYRTSGTSTFTLKKCIHLWMNGFTGYSIKPLQLSFFIGIFLGVIGFILLLIWLINGILSVFEISRLLLLAVFLFVSGINIFILGLIGDYIGRIYMCINNSPQYVIKNKLENRGTNNEKK